MEKNLGNGLVAIGVTKEELERKFVNDIKQIGIVSHGTMYDKGHWYWSFELKNGERKYWTDLSEESKKILF